jgi:hypothetical protein
MAEEKEVYPIDTFKVTLGGAEAGGLFNTVSGIGSSIDPTGFDHVDKQGKPQISKTPAKTHYQDLTCSRGADVELHERVALELPGRRAGRRRRYGRDRADRVHLRAPGAQVGGE